MPTHEHDRREPGPNGAEEIDTSHGYERSDVRASGIVVFLTALAVFVAVAGGLSYGIGKFINTRMAREDGPKSKWAAPVDVRPLGNMPSSPELKDKMEELTQRFPTPRLQTDDGNQEIADLHAKEDLLLEHYSWVDREQGKVRIPIERAMELIARGGLPVAPQVEHAPPMTGDRAPVATAPLTNGFARTGFEQDEAQAIGTRRPEQQK
jgi:hypothetical protein